MGQFGWSVLNGLVTTYLLFYYVPTSASGIEQYIPKEPIFGFVTVLTLIFIIDRIFGALTDPWIASRSDRSRSKYGRRISYMARSAIPFSLFAALIFIQPAAGESWINAAFLAVTLLAFYYFFSMYVTPYNALFPEITSDEKERLDVATITSVMWFLGYVAATFAPVVWAMIEQRGVPKSKAIQMTMFIFAGISAVCLLIPVLTIKEKDFTNAKPSNDFMWSALKIAFQNTNFRYYLIADFAYWISLCFFQMTLIQYVTVLLHLEETYLVVFSTVLGLTSFIFYVPINIVTKKVGTKKMLLIGYALFGVVYGLSALLGLFPVPGLIQGLLLMLVTSIPIAIFGILPNVVIADIAEVDSYKTGVNREGIYFGIRTFISKFANVVAMAILSVVLLIRVNGSSELALRITCICAIVFALIGYFTLQFMYNEKGVQSVLKKHRS